MKRLINNIIVLFLLCMSILLVPGILQGKSNIFVTTCLVGITTTFFIVNKECIYINKKCKNIIIINLIFWSYIYIHSELNNSINMDWVIKLCTINIISISCYLIILSNKELNNKFFKSFIILITMLNISYIITIMCSQFIDLSNLYIGKININNYKESGNIYFPFTIVYGVMHTAGKAFVRNQFIFREAGIAQMFLVWSYFNLKTFNMDKWIYKFLIVVGLISTFSTTTLFIFAITYGISKLKVKDKVSIKRVVIFPIIIVISITIIIFTPYIGLKDKYNTHGISISERTEMTVRGIQLFKENPWGIGYYNKTLDDYWHYNSGINLIANSYRIGFIGVFLIISLYWLPIIKEKNKVQYITSITPFFLTMLIAQPLIDATLVYIFLGCNYSYIHGGE